MAAGCIGSGRPVLLAPADELRAGVKTVCLEHVITPFPSEKIQARVTAYEGLLQWGLESAGWAVVAPDRVREVLDAAIEAHGTVYDSATGDRDEASFRARQSESFAVLRRELSCDAVASPSIAVVYSSWTNGVASWDGQRDHIDGGWGANGWVRALSLHLLLRDTGGKDLYFGTGGIQLLVNREETGFLKMEFKLKEVEDLLADARRNTVSVVAALEPFLPADVVRQGKPTAFGS